MRRYPYGRSKSSDIQHAYETDDPNWRRHGAAGTTFSLCGVRIRRTHGVFVPFRRVSCKTCAKIISLNY